MAVVKELIFDDKRDYEAERLPLVELEVIPTLRPLKLSVVIPCFNEERTLEKCVETVLGLRNKDIGLEILIVDDCSRDRSLEIARSLEASHREIRSQRSSTFDGAFKGWAGRCCNRFKVQGLRSQSSSLFLAFHRERVPDVVIKHVH